MKYKQNILHRRAFALIFAIILLVVFSTITGLIVSLSTDTSSTTAKVYLYNQAKLYSRSGIEMALLMIEDRERNDSNNCLQELNLTVDDSGIKFNILVYINYIGSNLKCGTKNQIYTVGYPESNGTVMIDAYVSTVDLQENITFYRRTVQKP